MNNNGLILDNPVSVAPLNLERPLVESIICAIRMSRKLAEEMFKTLVFESGEETVTITEVLRPAKGNEPVVVTHLLSGQKFCVDHYELDGVRL